MTDPNPTQLLLDADTVTTIISNINSLYSTAINHLTAYTFGIVGLVGVLIPVLVTFFQSKNLKAEKDFLQAHITDEISKAKLQIQTDVSNELIDKLQAEEERLTIRFEEKLKEYEKKIAVVDAGTFHLQATAALDKEIFDSATEDFCNATIKYFKGGDELNGQRTLKTLVQRCLPKINKDEYTDEEFEIEQRINHIIEILRELDTSSKYSDQIKDLKKASKEASLRDVAET